MSSNRKLQSTKKLQFPVSIIKSDSETGIVEAVVSVFGNMDLQTDIIDSGAFTKTITERHGQVLVLDAHRSNSATDVVGKPLEMRELTADELPIEVKSAFPEATGGLYTKTQFAIDTTKGKDIFNLISGGYVNKYSIGFQIMKQQFEERFVKDSDGKTVKQRVRVIKEVKLYEYSPVVFAANEATATISTLSFPIDKVKEMSVSRFVDTVTEEFYKQFPPKQVYDELFDDYYNDYEFRLIEVFNRHIIVMSNNPESPYRYYRVVFRIDGESNSILFSSMDNWKGGNYVFVEGEKSSTDERIEKIEDHILKLFEKLDELKQPLPKPEKKPLSKDELKEIHDKFRKLQLELLKDTTN